MIRRFLPPTRWLLLALLALPSGCGGADEPPSTASRTGRYDGSGRLAEGVRDRSALPNVVLLVLDTTRADAIEAPPGGRAPLPELAAYAQRVTWFRDASTSASWTAPSVTSILTGLLPSEHGVQGRFQASALVPSVATLAEYLRAIGYATAAFAGGGWVSPEMGLGQGFDRFVLDWDTRDGRHELDRWLAETDRTRPQFVFLHTYEAHDPYGVKLPPEGLEDPARLEAAQAFVAHLATLNPSESEPFHTDDPKALFLAWRGDPLTRHFLTRRWGRDRLAARVIDYQAYDLPRAPDRPALCTHLRERYGVGLSALDAHLLGLRERLGKAGLPGRTVYLVVSDHGEAFGEHDHVGHGRWLWDELTRGILLVDAPGLLPPGPVRGSCGAVDVVPTVLDLVGLPTPAGIAGRSLLPLARGREEGHPVRAEEFRLLYGGADEGVTVRLVSVRTERAKWISTWDPRSKFPTEVLFDLGADPAEAHPLAAEDLARFGAAFEREVGAARALVASFPDRTDNSGEGRFTGGE